MISSDCNHDPLLFAIVFLFAFAIVNGKPPFINSGTPSNIKSSFDCAVRYYAYEYGQEIQQRHDTFVSLFDALQLQACNYTRPQESLRQIPNYELNKKKTGSNTKNSSISDCIFYVDPNDGSDFNLGTSPNKALSTISQAIKSTREFKSNLHRKIEKSNDDDSYYSMYPCTINLMQGTFYLESTIILTPQDSHMTIQNFNGSDTTLSGGLPLEFDNNGWTLHDYQETQWQNFSNYNNVYGRVNVNTSSDLVMYVCIVCQPSVLVYVWYC